MGKQGARIAPLMKEIKRERGALGEIVDDTTDDNDLDEKQSMNKPAAAKPSVVAKQMVPTSAVKPVAASTSSAPINVWNRRLQENKSTAQASAVSSETEFPTLITSAQMLREQKEMVAAKGRRKTALDSDDDETVISFDAASWVAVDPSLLSPVAASAAKAPSAASAAAGTHPAPSAPIAPTPVPAPAPAPAASSLVAASSSILSSAAAAFFPSLAPASRPSSASSATAAAAAAKPLSQPSLTSASPVTRPKLVEPPGGAGIEDDDEWTVI